MKATTNKEQSSGDDEQSSSWEDYPIVLPSAPPLPPTPLFQSDQDERQNNEKEVEPRNDEKQTQEDNTDNRCKNDGELKIGCDLPPDINTANDLAISFPLQNDAQYLNTRIDGNQMQITISLQVPPQSNTLPFASSTTTNDDDYVLVFVDPRQSYEDYNLMMMKNDIPHIGVCTSSRTMGAGVVVGLVSVPYLGIGMASVASIVAAYESTKDGAIGDICRAMGDVICTAKDRVVEINKKHDLTKKGGLMVVTSAISLRGSKSKLKKRSFLLIGSKFVRSLRTRFRTK